MATFIASLAAINASLNSLAALSTLAGIYYIRRGERLKHQYAMMAAAGFSAIFLVFYLMRVYFQGTHLFPGTGVAKVVYLVILFSHITLAIVVVPLVLMSIYRGLTKQFAAHRKIARITYPIWLYVSITGVIVYLMLYQINWA